MSWLDYFTWPRAAISDIERDMAIVKPAVLEMFSRLNKMEKHMAADRDLLAQIAADLTTLATPVAALVASEAALRARVSELEGEAAADEAGDLEAAGAVKAAFDNLAGKLTAEPESPDVEPLPEAPVEEPPAEEPPADGSGDDQPAA